LREQQQKDKEKIEAKVNSMYAFVHKNLDPALEIVQALSTLPEGQEILAKMLACTV
jgi:hypothetical protein